MYVFYFELSVTNVNTNNIFNRDVTSQCPIKEMTRIVIKDVNCNEDISLF